MSKMRGLAMTNVPVLDGPNFEEWKSRIDQWALASGFNEYQGRSQQE